MSLRDEIMEIRGIGDAKADEIMAVIEEHSDSGLEKAAQDALEKLREGHPSHAAGHLESALED